MTVISQAEADALFGMLKRPERRTTIAPAAGTKTTIPLKSLDGREGFLLDVNRRTINLWKIGFQKRARQVIVLARLDWGGPPHRNPDGSEVLTPHLHTFREGFGDKWAMPLPDEHFTNPSDPWTTLIDFIRYCHIVEPPAIQRPLE